MARLGRSQFPRYHRHINQWYQEWWDKNTPKYEQITANSAPVDQEAIWRPSGGFKKGTIRVTVNLDRGNREFMEEFWDWLYLDQPFVGQWHSFTPPGADNPIYIFTHSNDAVLMRLRYG